MTQYDAIIVGARCGGAPLAMLLARAGHKVLLVDRMAFGSDIMSTHFVKRTGAAKLQKWGLLDQVKALGTPAIETLNFQINDTRLSGTAPPCEGVTTDFTPRRFYLDKILVDAAIESGAEVRDQFTVKELIFDGDQVVGIKGASAGGDVVTERAKIVVGADGVRSMVAKSVAAEHYIDAGTHACGHYAYYSGMRDSNSTANPHGCCAQQVGRLPVLEPQSPQLSLESPLVHRSPSLFCLAQPAAFIISTIQLFLSLSITSLSRGMLRAAIAVSRMAAMTSQLPLRKETEW